VVALTGGALVGCGDDGASETSTTTSTRDESSGVTTPSTSATSLAPTTTFDGVVDELRVEVIERRDRDADVFTQGFEADDGVLFETGGLYGESTVRIVDAQTGIPTAEVGLAPELFAEGLTLVDDELIVLTWQEEVALVLDATTLAEVDRYAYEGEGWGLCDDGERLVMSNGSDRLTFRDRTTFAPLGEVAVSLDGAPVSQLNELECVAGEVYANVWQTDTIVRIDPDTGTVTARIDASGLLDEAERAQADVLNGIAHDPAAGTFLLTGKLWPAMFEVRFVPVA
jgi:glutamine cyclotransferase